MGLTWLPADSGGSPTAFKIYRSTAPAFTPAGAPLSTVNANDTGFLDSGLTNFTAYYYEVVASNDVGDSAPSDAVQATPAAGLPGQPRGLSAQGTDGRVSLAWSAPSGGGAPFGYRLYRGSQQGFTLDGALLGDLALNPTAYADANVVNFTTYYYAVTAENPAGEGIPSNFAFAMPNNGAPSGPKNLRAAAGNGRVDLSWLAPDGGDVFEYRVFRSTTSSVSTSGAPYAALQGDQLSYADTGVTNFQTYFYRVVAENPVGTGPDSAEQSAEPNDGLPGQTQSLVATGGDRQVTLTWIPPTGGTPFEYRIFRSTTGGFTLEGPPQATISGGTGTYLDGGVENFTRYYYRVIAANPLGTGAASDEQSAMPNNGLPGQPSLLADAGDARVHLTWDAPPGGTVFEYRIYRGTASGVPASGMPFSVVDGATFSFPDTPVTNFQTYYYRVIAANPVGTGSASVEQSAFPNNGLPGQPGTFASATASSNVTLTWAEPGTGGTVFEYRVYRSTTSTVPTGGAPFATVQPATLTYSDTAVTNYTTYFYAVAAANPMGQGDSSSALSVMPGLPPSTPLGVSIASGSGSISLAWNLPGDTIPVESYVIFRGSSPGVPASGTPYASTGPATTTFAESGLVNNKAYFYLVAARNKKGDSVPSPELTGYPRVPNSEVISGDPSPLPQSSVNIGRAVALSGNYAIIGAPMRTRQATGATGAGAAYVYERDADGHWIQRAFLEEPTPTPATGAQFGSAVAIDGDVALVGAPGETRFSTSEQHTGRVSIFRRQPGGGWAWETDLEPPAGTTGAQFGFSVAISGNFALIGAYHTGTVSCGTANATLTGTVFPYEFKNSAWVAKTPILPPSSGCTAGVFSEMAFGFSVAVSGGLAIAGAPHEGVSPSDLGAAYFFVRDVDSGEWSYIPGSKATGPNVGITRRFGWSVAIAGTWAAVGAPLLDCRQPDCAGAGFTDSGLVGFYEFVAPNWNSMGNRFSPAIANQQQFGLAVSMTSSRAVVSALASQDGTPGANVFSIFSCARASSTWTCSATPIVTQSGVNQNPISMGDATGQLYSVGLTVAVHLDNVLVGIPFADAPATTSGDNTGDFAFY